MVNKMVKKQNKMVKRHITVTVVLLALMMELVTSNSYRQVNFVFDVTPQNQLESIKACSIMEDGVKRGLVTVVVGREPNFPTAFRYKYINEDTQSVGSIVGDNFMKAWKITDLGLTTQRFYGIFYINNIGWIIGGD